METLPRYWSFVRGIHRSPVNSPHKGQWRGALMFSLICTRINGWVNNGEAGDLRRHRAHYDAIVMSTAPTVCNKFVTHCTYPKCIRQTFCDLRLKNAVQKTRRPSFYLLYISLSFQNKHDHIIQPTFYCSVSQRCTWRWTNTTRCHLVRNGDVNDIYVSTQRGRDKMADIFQTTVSNAFSWMKMCKFRLRFHWISFPRVFFTISIGSKNGLSPTRRRAIIWTNDGLDWWRLYASLGLNDPWHHHNCV